MNHLTKEYVTKLKDSLLFINAVVIIYNASLFLLSTKYISVHYYARDFLNKVSYITRTPQNIFFESIFLFIILVLLMKLREKDNLKMANGLVYIEIILSEVARCMNYFLSLCRDFPWTTHWSIFAVFCFLSWLLGYFSASCIRSLSRIRWKVMKCLRVSLRLLTGFFRPF